MLSRISLGYFEDVQRVVLHIPRGKVATYGRVAREAGYPRTARQVAWALRAAEGKNLPWQRVLGSRGRILLPGESGLLQRMLLEMEGVVFKGNRVCLEKCEFHFSQAPRIKAPSTVERFERPSGKHLQTK